MGESPTVALGRVLNRVRSGQVRSARVGLIGAVLSGKPTRERLPGGWSLASPVVPEYRPDPPANLNGHDGNAETGDPVGAPRAGSAAGAGPGEPNARPGGR